jgi:peptide/nickel transport system permease protein
VRRYVLRRVLQMIPLLAGVSLLVFVLLASAPGDPIDMLIRSNPSVTMNDIARLKHLYGLDQPIIVRYAKWLGRTLQGDLGWSLAHQVPVARLVGERLPNSLMLVGTGIVIAILVAIPAGIYSALRQYSVGDYLASLGTFVGFSIPVFWFGLIMIYIFAVKLRVLPPGGMREAGAVPGWPATLDYLRHLILPSLVIALYSTAALARYTRSSMLEVIRQDYIRTARAKGLSEIRIAGHHALRNAMIPIVTVLALTMPALFGGAPVTESVFAWPGIGQLLVQSVLFGDYVVAMAVLMMIAVLVLAFNLAADIVYGLLDPRIRYA